MESTSTGIIVLCIFGIALCFSAMPIVEDISRKHANQRIASIVGVSLILAGLLVSSISSSSSFVTNVAGGIIASAGTVCTIASVISMLVAREVIFYGEIDEYGNVVIESRQEDAEARHIGK